MTDKLAEVRRVAEGWAQAADNYAHRSRVAYRHGDFTAWDRLQAEANTLGSCAKDITAILDAPDERGEGEHPADKRQRDILAWVRQAFGVDSVEQRALRMLEEAVELYQAAGGNEAQAAKLVGFVFARPVGEVAQEIGGLGLTLAALAETAGMSADVETSREFGRVLQKPLAHFTARNEAKNAAGFKAPAPPAHTTGDEGIWRCSGCGEPRVGLCDTSWRYTGEVWEHKCPGRHPQCGYEPARYFGTGDEGKAERVHLDARGFCVGCGAEGSLGATHVGWCPELRRVNAGLKSHQAQTHAFVGCPQETCFHVTPAHHPNWTCHAHGCGQPESAPCHGREGR